MNIYFETGPLHSILEFTNMLPPNILNSSNGYRSMVLDAKNCIKNKWDIYTNDISLLGSIEIFGESFKHNIYIRNTKNKWVKFNSYLIKKLNHPQNIEKYFKKYICFGGANE